MYFVPKNYDTRSTKMPLKMAVPQPTPQTALAAGKVDLDQERNQKAEGPSQPKTAGASTGAAAAFDPGVHRQEGLSVF